MMVLQKSLFFTIIFTILRYTMYNLRGKERGARGKRIV
jgi:hypothetical protein